MPITKQQALNFLNNKKAETSKGNIKYYTVGCMRILVQKDIITPADIMAEFPEFA